MTSSNIQLIIDINDPNLNKQETEQLTQNLMQEMQELEEVETVEPYFDSKPSLQYESITGFLTSILMAEVNPANLAKLFAFLSDRLGNKPIKLKVKTPDGRELTVEASSKEELEYLIKQAEEFIDKQ